MVRLRDGDNLCFSAHHGPIPVGVEKRSIDRNWVSGRSVIDKAPIHVHDLTSAEGDGFPEAQRTSRPRGIRTILSAPLLREGESIGVIVLRRTEVNPFSDKHVAFASKTFADQAVIAIGNVRLFDEVQAKTRELSEALTYQTGSENILRVIASSPTDVGPVLDAIVDSACELCEAVDAVYIPERWRAVPASQRASWTDTGAAWRNGRPTGAGSTGRSVIDRAPDARARSCSSRRRRGTSGSDSGRPGQRRLSEHFERAFAARGREHRRDRAPPHRGAARSATSRSPCCRPSPIRP